MANDHRHLPKAKPTQLTPALQHQLAVWWDMAYPDDNVFLTLARRPCWTSF